ncbi:protocatechuate 3,4-dioxygenase subunit alpha [Burkholderia cenocepacia]|uniref:protocatechuate 3,4-dioxygenase subunit alpha n=1 Tax=Burkholderia cenocepacia TaxID=95486 RepID=UPI0028593DBF|nr:protocatechuate 3,4-dioxygenase subunit alpha [Burkholderia cenocepacia]MDR5645481.1 protocatechuate 3,4-dioxygenase subunit alpha [Burkholderia cenocepacia]
MSTFRQTPSQTVGPFFAYGLVPQQYNYDLTSLFDGTVAQPHAAGDHMMLVGRVYDGENRLIPDALIELVQADASGRYVRTAAEAAERGFKGFARVGTGTDPQQRFVVETVKPGSTGADSAPHIDVIVLMRGMLLHAYTRIYFEEEAEANARDAVLQQVPAERRATLLARRDPDAVRPVYRFDIHMQGPDETVFFDV